jgi:serine/threonine-protein kinase
LTGVGKVVGTPNYLAPEIVTGSTASDRSDQYSLALTVHEVLTGYPFMKGPSLSATMVNQTKLVAPPVADLVPGTPRSLSDAVARALA